MARIQVANEELFNTATMLLVDVFRDKYTNDLYEWMRREKYHSITQHISQVAGRRYSKEAVAGVQTVVLLASRHFSPVTGTAKAFTIGEVFSEASKYMDGKSSRMLSELRKMNAELPPWLEKR